MVAALLTRRISRRSSSNISARWYRFAARRVGPATAEDLAAETFATAYRRRATFDPARGSLRAWLFGIVANLVRSHWRAEQHLLALDALGWFPRLMPWRAGTRWTSGWPRLGWHRNWRRR